MKNLTLLMAVLYLSVMSSQLYSQLNYLGFSIDQPDRTELNQFFSDYQLYQISVSDLETYLRAPSSDGQINLFLSDEHQWSLRLSPNELRSPDFQLNTLTTSGLRMLSNIPTPTFHGTVEGGGKVCLTIFENYLSLWIRAGDQQYFLESANRFDPNLKDGLFVLYEVSKIINDTPGRCASSQARDLPRGNTNLPATETSTCFRAEIAIASDYSMVEDLGGIMETHLQALQILSLVNSDWNESDFADDVFFSLTEHLISTCEDCDPWTDSDQAGELLTDFRDWAVADGFSGGHDLGQLWTTRDICSDEDCGVIGLATLSSICTSSPYHLLEKNTNTTALLRSLASHEIGHNFSLQHNYEVNDGCDLNGRIPYLMDPVNQGATDWSDGTLDCDGNNVAALGLFLPGLECIDDCFPNNCPSISGLVITEQTDSTIILNWSSNTAGEYRAILRDVVNDIYLDTIITTTPTVDFGVVLERCGVYQVLVQSQCSNGSSSAYANVLFETDQTTDLEVLEVRVIDCFDFTSTYDLLVRLTHGGGNGDGYRVVVNSDTSTIVYPYGNSPRQMVLSGLIADGNPVDLTVFPATGEGENCASTYRYTAPKGDCSLEILENFDTGLPRGWEVTTTTGNLSFPYEWSWGGSGRFISSYKTDFDSTAATLGATIDSTNMIYFDDDVISQDVFTGATSIITPNMNLSTFANLTLDFDYMFDRVDDPSDPFVVFNNKPVETESYFSVDVFDGTEWQEVFREETNPCGFFSIWKTGCVNSQSLDVSAYSNADFQVRFNYSDGENSTWAGMIAIDNVMLAGNFDISLPVSLTEFKGYKKETTAQLIWTTESELDNDYFTLERSLDGRTFQPLATINGQGTSLSENEYAYTDEHPLVGTNYYRLKQTDFDGTVSYIGDIIALDFTDRGVLVIRPNPVRADQFYFDLPASESDFRKMQIHNAAGQLIKEEILDDSETISVSVDNIQNGIYFLSIKTNTNLESHRFVILR